MPLSNRRQFLHIFSKGTALAALTQFAILPTRAQSKPNIVLIVSDDMGYADLGCYGSSDLKTPMIDHLAEQGVRFTSNYSNAPECTPTRTALMTGRYQQRIGGLECALGNGHVGRYDDAIRLRQAGELGLPLTETTIAEMLKNAGYATGITGKWHLGYDLKFNPLNQGFDYFWGCLGGGVDYFHHHEPEGMYTLYQGKKVDIREGYMTELITDEAVSFIRKHREHPFFLYVPYTAPHSPYQGPDDYQDAPKNNENWNDGTRETYAEMVAALDEGVGRIIAELDQQGLTKNTLIIFVSDNGGTARLGDNGPFARGKGSLYEGGIRVPLIIRWDGNIKPATVSDQVTITMDLTASIARIAGAQPPEDKPFDGMDIIAHIEQERSPVERTLFFRYRRGDHTWHAVRDSNLKYLSFKDGDKTEEHLFDLKKDQTEQHDFISDTPEKAQSLRQKLKAWEMEMAKTMR
ncbi:MAG: sulfatase [bacterium]|jgi:arylsulfatase A-like enzyme